MEKADNNRKGNDKPELTAEREEGDWRPAAVLAVLLIVGFIAAPRFFGFVADGHLTSIAEWEEGHHADGNLPDDWSWTGMEVQKLLSELELGQTGEAEQVGGEEPLDEQPPMVETNMEMLQRAKAETTLPNGNNLTWLVQQDGSIRQKITRRKEPSAVPGRRETALHTEVKASDLNRQRITATAPAAIVRERSVEVAREGHLWAVQVASSTNRERIEELRRKLDLDGYASSTEDATVDGQLYIRVIIGSFSSQRAAREKREQLTQLGYLRDDMFVRAVQ